jgi:hypothetical protein
VGPTQRPSERVGLQGAWPSSCSPRPRRRLCLLKGCEQPFSPSHPQARYCSAECHTAARRWRCWRASRTYRASDHGQARRREQSRQYRQRLRARRAEREAEAAGVPEHPPAEPREGQRPAPNSEESCCARPGCYEQFVRCSRSPLQKCCGWLCRQALRRVRQREARWRWRMGRPMSAPSNSPVSVRGSPSAERRILQIQQPNPYGLAE